MGILLDDNLKEDFFILSSLNALKTLFPLRERINDLWLLNLCDIICLLNQEL